MINKTSTLNQENPKIASIPSTNSFVCTWQDNRENEGHYNIYARSFNEEGCQKSSDFKVSTGQNGNKINPDVGAFEDGSFVVVWQDDKDGNGYYEIICRKFNKEHQPISNEIVVNSKHRGQQLNPKVATTKNNSFVVTWEDDKDKNNYYQIHAAVFDSNCRKIVKDFTVNSQSDGNQRRPSITANASGDFFIVWEDDKDKNNFYQIYGAGFKNLSKQRIFSDIVINQDSKGQQLNPDIASDKRNAFTVTWEDDKDKNGVFQIHAASFDVTGKRLHKDIVVNQMPNGQQLNPQIIKDHSIGNFHIVWQDDTDGKDVYLIKLASFSKNGSRLKNNITINKDKSGQQIRPAISSLNSYNIILWQDDTNGNNYFDVVGTNKKM